MLTMSDPGRSRLAVLIALSLALQVGSARAKEQPARMNPLADAVRVVSGGFNGGNQAVIQIGDQVLVDEKTFSGSVAGVHLVAVLNRRVMLQCSYNTCYFEGPGEGLARDIASLPRGTLVVVAVKDEATARFDKRAQEALQQIGAKIGLYQQPFRTSYICIGTKGLEPGQAVEKIGMGLLTQEGPRVGKPCKLVFPPKPDSRISSKPGVHEGFVVDETEILYYIPSSFDPSKSNYLVVLHDGVDWHRPDALRLLELFKPVADQKGLVAIAPVFDLVPNWKVNPRADLNEAGHFRDPRIMKALGMKDFESFLTVLGPRRSDTVLIDAFKCFNDQLMKRERFRLYGRGHGADFVCRFLYFHPQLVERAAFSEASSLTLPDRARNYPQGLNTAWFRRQYRQLNLDGLVLTPEQVDARLYNMLNRYVYVIAAEPPDDAAGASATATDTAPADLSAEPATAPAGRNDRKNTPLGIARSFVEAMKAEHQAQCASGKRPQSDPFRFELHTVPTPDLDAGTRTAIELLFPAVAAQATR